MTLLSKPARGNGTKSKFTTWILSVISFAAGSSVPATVPAVGPKLPITAESHSNTTEAIARRLAVTGSSVSMKITLKHHDTEAEVPYILNNAVPGGDVAIMAGLMIDELTIDATGGLVNTQTTQLFITPGDKTRCTNINGARLPDIQAELFGGNFVGADNPSANTGGIFTHTQTSNKWTNQRFLIGGKFTICYRDGDSAVDDLSPPWEAMSSLIHVYGATKSDYKFFCVNVGDFPCGAQIQTQYPPHTTYFNNADPLLAAPYLQTTCGGTGQDVCTDMDPPPITRVKPAKMDILTSTRNCEVAKTGGDLFINDFVDFTGNNFPDRASYNPLDGNEIFPLGFVTPKPATQTFRLCYCPNFRYNQKLGTCGNQRDYIQDVGWVILTDVQITKTDINTATENTIPAHPTLLLNLVLHCGDASAGADVLGCADNKNEPTQRIKIIESHPQAHLPYYDENNKCRTVEEASTYASPENCVSSVTCNKIPDLITDKTRAKYNGIRIRGMRRNAVQIKMKYDVCYCDAQCSFQANWFKFGSFEVIPIDIAFLDGNKDPQDEAVVNTAYFLKIVFTTGASHFGNPLEPDTVQSYYREMKIIPDPSESTSSQECMRTNQDPELIEGHAAYSNLDLQFPQWLPDGQLYGWGDDIAPNPAQQTFDIPSLRVKKPGKYAVCYCDNICNNNHNWAVAGTVTVSGPTGGTSVQFSQNLLIDLVIKGHNLRPKNRIYLEDGGLSSCANRLKPLEGEDQGEKDGKYVQANMLEDAIQLASTKPNNVVSATMNVYDTQGVVISMATSHGLTTGDVVEFSGISVKVQERDSS